MLSKFSPTFKSKSRINMHFEVRKKVLRKLTLFNQKNMKLLDTIMYKQRENRSILAFQISFERPSFHIEVGSFPLTRKYHEENNDTHCDLPLG